MVERWVIGVQPDFDWTLEDYRNIIRSAVDRDGLSKLDSYVKKSVGTMSIVIAILTLTLQINDLGVLGLTAVGIIVFIIAYHHAKENELYDWVVVIASIFTQLKWIVPSTLLLSAYVTLSVLYPIGVELSGIGLLVPFAIMSIYIVLRYIFLTKTKTQTSLKSMMSRILKEPKSPIYADGRAWGLRSWLVLGFAEGYDLMLLFGSIGFVSMIVLIFTSFSSILGVLIAQYIIFGFLLVVFMVSMFFLNFRFRNTWILSRINDAVTSYLPTDLLTGRINKEEVLSAIRDEISNWE